jgi:hypothetical protein
MGCPREGGRFSGYADMTAGAVRRLQETYASPSVLIYSLLVRL